MARRELPAEVKALHEQFKGKRLSGAMLSEVKAIKKWQHFDLLAKRAKAQFGLTPREIAIHWALAVILQDGDRSSHILPNEYDQYSLRSLIDNKLWWQKTPQQKGTGIFFWSRFS